MPNNPDTQPVEFLIQCGWSRREGTEQAYVQIIGHDHRPGTEPTEAITGRLYTNDGANACAT